MSWKEALPAYDPSVCTIWGGGLCLAMNNAVCDCGCVRDIWLAHGSHEEGYVLTGGFLVPIMAPMADAVLAVESGTRAGAFQAGCEEDSLDEETVRKEGLYRLLENNAFAVEAADIKKGVMLSKRIAKAWLWNSGGELESCVRALRGARKSKVVPLSSGLYLFCV